MRGVSLRRRGMVSAVLIAAVAVGWSEWIVEAFVSYGGLARRLQAASAENTAGLHMALGLEARALAGPTLCRRVLSQSCGTRRLGGSRYLR